MNTQRHPSHSPDDQVWLYPVIFVLGLCVLHWIGANLASLLTHRGWVLSGTDTALAILKLGPHFRSPALAYPTDVQANVAGPVWYWTCVGLVFVVVIVAAAMIGVRVTGSRTEAVNRRRRLGVPTEPSLATPKELRPLFVRTPEPDRLVLMPYRRGWLSTEAPTYGGRRGIQGAVAVIGASQSGKTTALVESVTHWSGPAVVCSVKTDLMRLTIDAASARGDVKVFDPLCISGLPSARWSPLRAAVTLEGATAAASLLVHAAGDGSANDRFWRGQAEQLLAGMLWAAANIDGHTMANVVTWVLNLDIPDEDGRGTLAPLVRLLRDSPDKRVALEAAEIDGWLQGQWKTDPKTTSSVYATARDAVWPWANPRVRASASACDIDLAWLTSGANTLYLCAPLGDRKLGLVFSALLQDLIEQAFAHANLIGPMTPRVLLCIDETANTPMPKLAEWSSTLTGTGAQLVTVWQSKAQLDEIYGHHADTVLTNHRTKLIFPSGLSDMSTANYITHLVGDEHARAEIEDRSYGGASRRPGDRIPASSTAFLPPHVLRRAQPGDALLIHGKTPPAWVRSRQRAR